VTTRSCEKEIISNVFVSAVVIDALLFFFTSLFVQSYHWTTDWQGSSHHDHWGWKMSPNYFTFLGLALSLSVIIIVVYPFFLQSRARIDSGKGRMLRKRYLLIGFLMPVLYQYSGLGLDIFGYSDFGATITQVAVPILPFIPFSFTLLMLQTTLLGLALTILTVIAIIKYERGAISYRVFLMPIVLSLAFSLGLLGFSLYNILVFQQMLVLIPVPSFSLGVLLYGRELVSSPNPSSHSSEKLSK